MLLTGKLYKEEKQKFYNAQNGKCLICQRELLETQISFSERAF
ncbi:hypothetical protein [Shigella phage CT01]|nr:hypothetical protein [Shigella phage CT01]